MCVGSKSPLTHQADVATNRPAVHEICKEIFLLGFNQSFLTISTSFFAKGITQCLEYCNFTPVSWKRSTFNRHFTLSWFLWSRGNHKIWTQARQGPYILPPLMLCHEIGIFWFILLERQTCVEFTGRKCNKTPTLQGNAQPLLSRTVRTELRFFRNESENE